MAKATKAAGLTVDREHGFDSGTPSNATFSVPLGNVPNDAYLSRHVEARLDRSQALALKRLMAGLRKRNDELRSGRPVVTPADAVRWLLEQVTA